MSFPTTRRIRSRVRLVFFGLAMWLVSALAFPEDTCAQAGALPPAETKRWSQLTSHTPEAFAKLAEVQSPANLDPPDRLLLAAAIFHETNRRRTQLGVPALKADAGAFAAAAQQAAIMAKKGQLTHVNPDLPEARTLRHRLRQAGLEPSGMAENAATVFVRDQEPGRPYFQREEGGKSILSLEPGGPPLAVRSPHAAAVALLDAWMKSPGHRANLASREYSRFGAGIEWSAGGAGGPVWYAIQVFTGP